jgi:outer membrane protein OmpA-like peptidoglycan-associated protein
MQKSLKDAARTVRTNGTMISLVLVATLTASGCVSYGGPAPLPEALSFNYVFDGPKPSEVVQIFGLGADTVVQLRDARDHKLVFLDDGNAEIPFRVVGQNIVLQGRPNTFTLLGPGQVAKVMKRGYVSPPERVVVSTGKEVRTAGTPSPEDAAVLKEINRIRKEIADLKTLMAAAQEPSNSGRNAEQPTVLDVLRVSFPDNSATFEPKAETRRALVDSAKSSKRIFIRGFTDSTTATPKATQLAIARAQAAKSFLIDRGIDQSKIEVGAEASGGFIADNKSKEGRGANRRVEISFS